ncbi:MAG TPA: diaminopimelate decarboxylase [Candidatus Eremiobacteraceae bacterium]|nr:diaminopimelate decarboxylase [Candidatus Eremiobacteraceae bacterium]
MSIRADAPAHNGERTVDAALGGCDAFDLARRFGTPLLVIDEAILRARMAAFREAFRTADVTYAAKALMLKAIVRIAAEEDLAVDVCSAGELHTALRAGLSSDRCLMHGCFKTHDEIELAVSTGVRYVVVDHRDEIAALDEVVRAHRKRQDVLVRVNPEIATDTHEHVQTSGPDSKFGFAIADGQAAAAIKLVMDAPGLALAGIHCHIGSRIGDLCKYEEEIAALGRFARDCRASSGIAFGVVDIGGGIGVSERGEPAPTPSQWARVVFDAFERHFEIEGLARPLIVVEPGRALVTQAGTSLYTIGVRKTLPDGTRALIVDGGLSDNPRPALYDARYDVTLLKKARAQDPTTASASTTSPGEVFTVFGRHCEADRLFPDVNLDDPQPGDLLAVHNTGAYTYSMASNYNRFPRPAVVLARAGQAKLIARRESLGHMLDLDV